MDSKHYISLAAFGMALYGIDIPTPIDEKKKVWYKTTESLIEKGHKPFVIEGETIYALNKRNAEKKHRQRKKTKVDF